MKISQDRNLLTRILTKNYLNQLKQGISQWKHSHMRSKIIEEVNTEGDVAVEAVRVKRRVEILKKFLIQHGHSREDIDKELAKRKERTKSIMKAFIIKCFFKTSKFSVLPKSFNQLKAWVKTRKLYRNAFET